MNEVIRAAADLQAVCVAEGWRFVPGRRLRAFLKLATAVSFAFLLVTAPSASVATQNDPKFEQIAALVEKRISSPIRFPSRIAASPGK